MQYFENGKWVRNFEINDDFLNKFEKIASKAEGIAWKHEVDDEGKHYINSSGNRVAEIVFYENENAEFIGMANKGVILGMIQRIRDLEQEINKLRVQKNLTRKKITIYVECDEDGIQDVGWNCDPLK